MYKDFEGFMEIMKGNLDQEAFNTYFNHETGYPAWYMYKDPKTFAVVRYITPLELLCFRSYLITTVVLSVLSFTGLWKLYLLFNRVYPGISDQLAIGVLFIPSVVFWGSGLLKDTITFSAACWFTYSFFKVFVVKENRLVYLIAISKHP